MFRLLWKLIKFSFGLFLFCLAVAVVRAIIGIIRKYWAICLLILILSAGVYFFYTSKAGKKNVPKRTDLSHTTQILDSLDALIDKGFSNSVETDETAHKEKNSDESTEQIPRNLNVLLEEESQPAIETEQQLQDFLNSHVLIRSFITRVVGVSYPNDDGSSRQDILSRCLHGEPVGLYWHTFREAPACAVISNHGQIGYLNADLAADLYDAYVNDDDENKFVFSSAISDITGGTDGMHYGCTILLSIYRQSEEEIPPLPLPDASNWNEEIPANELTTFIAERPFYDSETMHCVAESYDDYRNRFINLERFVVLDIETTGLNPKEDKLIEIAAVKFEHFQVTGTFATLINPGIPLPRRITELTGITQEELRWARGWKEIEQDLLAFIGDLPLVGHNIVGFDIRFIKNAVGRSLNNPLVDTLHYSRNVFPDLPRYKLSYLKSLLGINVETSHRALDDVKTTFFLLAACIKQDHCGEPTTEIPYISSTQSSYNTYVPPIPKKSKPARRKHIDTKTILPTCANINQDNPLFGKRIVFTGTLTIPREHAMQLAVNNGALLRKSVSGKTDYLVVGVQDLSVVGADGMSTKEEKAHQLIDAGTANIQIIDEKKFFELVSKG